MIDHMRGWTRYDWLWAGWIASFLAIEMAAVRNKSKGDTLSEVWWWLSGTHGKPHKHVWTIRALLFGFSSWLVAHLWTRKV